MEPAGPPSSATLEWLHRINVSISKYALPLAFGRRPNRRLPTQINAASAAAVDLGETPFLLTAAHVMSAALERLKEAGCHLIAGPVELHPSSGAVSIAEDLDVATITISPQELRAFETDGLWIVRPPRWPPPPPCRDEAVILAGYPGTWRLDLAWDELAFRSFTMLALIHEVRESEFLCHSDPAYRVEHRVAASEELPPVDLPGLSGGPAFLVTRDPAQPIVPQLCGVVRQGLSVGGDLILRYARLDRLGRDGSIAKP